MNNKGKIYEEMACAYLENKGYEILEKNFICRYGEIDIVAKDNEFTVFVEVKYRKDSNFSQAIFNITKSKMAKLIKSAQYYYSLNGFDYSRFDAIIIEGDKIEHIKNISSF